MGVTVGQKLVLQVGKSSIKYMRGNISIAHASDSASAHPYPAITLCPSWLHERKNMDTDNLTADFNLLRPVDQLVFSVEYSYQDENRQIWNISITLYCINLSLYYSFWRTLWKEINTKELGNKTRDIDDIVKLHVRPMKVQDNYYDGSEVTETINGGLKSCVVINIPGTTQVGFENRVTEAKSKRLNFHYVA